MTEPDTLKRKADEPSSDHRKEVKTSPPVILKENHPPPNEDHTKGILRVKPEFRVLVDAAAEASLVKSTRDSRDANINEDRHAINHNGVRTANSDGDDDAEAAGSANKDQYRDKSSKNKRRGQNIPKERKFKAQHDAVKLCNKVSRGDSTCPLGDQCRYSHDVSAYLLAKGPDLGTVCPQFELLGECKFGIKCRFSGAHTNAEGMQVVKDVVLSEDVFVKNHSMKDAIRDIKQGRIDRTRSTQFIEWWAKEETKLHNSLKGNKSSKKQESEVDDLPAAEESAGLDSGIAKDTDIECAKMTTETVIEGAEMVTETVIEDTKVVTETSIEDTKVATETATNDIEIVAETVTKDTEIATETAIKEDSKDTSTPNQKEHETIEAESQGDTYIPLRPNEKKKVDFHGKTYLAPLTTVGNIPFRRICKGYGVDITCSEMAISRQLLSGSPVEWALTRRHVSEDLFGIQVACNDPCEYTRVVEALCQKVDMDFIDLNMGCPIDVMTKRGAGSALLERRNKVRGMLLGAVHVSSVPITVKMRMGLTSKRKVGHKIIPLARDCGVAALSLHGRSKEQRYTKLADWDYTLECAKMCQWEPQSFNAPVVASWSQGPPEPPAFFGNGDVFSPQEYWDHFDDAVKADSPLAGIMIGRGALTKPWIFKEIKERKLWDISSGERFDMLKDFTKFGLECWGSDTMGVNTTRRFMCEWLSFLYRYVPVGILEVLPQRVNERPERFVGRNDLETLMASDNSSDWIKITEMLLGPAPESFQFLPK
ncbi:hypothetical protein BSLG_009054 [Batrachochytrium salamandrivorans]|nr:hypothetical protein BSLG_009054 [Batrachochytrium salamandrivorans]